MYESEQEQVEALKKWWRENGRLVLAGLVVGLGGVAGWNFWQSQVQAQQGQASALYQQVMAVRGELPAELKARAQALLEERPGSGYAPLIALVLADRAHESGRLEDAQARLRWVMEHAGDEGLVRLARLRLGRLMLEQGRHTEALTLLDDAGSGEYAGAFLELRGDLLLAQGQREEARETYRRALQALPQGSTSRQRVQLKLDDLGEVRRAEPARDSVS